MPELLTRAAFRAAVFARDGGRCVICAAVAVDPHHILDRALWPDGGYFLANGVALCAACHQAAEATHLTCETLRRAAGITTVVLPPSITADEPVDKWGNPCLPNGQRLRGPLLGEVGPRLLTAGVVFTNRVKYPRTPHVPFSQAPSDDMVLADLRAFEGQDIVVTPKYDGGNFTIGPDYFHARSTQSAYHPSQWPVRQIQQRVGPLLDHDMRICGELISADASHAIHYPHLVAPRGSGFALPPFRFLVFGIWVGLTCVSWDDTATYAAALDLDLVPVLYRGPWDETRLRTLYTPILADDPCEGWVVRYSQAFTYGVFTQCCAKFVAPGFTPGNPAWR